MWARGRRDKRGAGAEGGGGGHVEEEAGGTFATKSKRAKRMKWGWACAGLTRRFRKHSGAV